MTMGSESIKKKMQMFQASIKQLSSGVESASSLWRDERFSELSSSVAEIANQSKDVMVTGGRCCSSIDRFEKIASEKY